MEPEKEGSSDSLQSISPGPAAVLIDPARLSSTSRGHRPADPPLEEIAAATTTRHDRTASSAGRRISDVERSSSHSRGSSRSSPPPPRSERSDRSDRSERSNRSERRHNSSKTSCMGSSTRSTGSTRSPRSSGSSSSSASNMGSSRPIHPTGSLRSHQRDEFGRTERARSRSSSHLRHTRGGSTDFVEPVPIPPSSLLRDWLQAAWASRQCRWGIGLFFTGLVLVAIAAVTDIEGNAFRNAEIRKVVVVDSPNHPEFKAWATGEQQRTPLFYTYHLYNITNPTLFLAGQPPAVQEVGPFTFQQRTKKVNVTFSDEGRLVTYITQTQHDFVGDPVTLDTQSVYFFNLPYSVAVYTAGSETNLLKIGSQQALAEILYQMQTYFLPTLKENAVVMAIQMAVDAMTQILDAMQAPADATPTRWGGGCTSNMFGKICGFDAAANFFKVVDRKNKMDLNLLQLCINTKLTEAERIPLATVRRLWNPDDEYAIFNIGRASASERYGISYWLWGDADVQDAITRHFGLTNRQYNALRVYLLEIYRNPMLEIATVKIFKESLQPEDAGTAEVNQWSDFMWRQWAVGDVITRLKNESMAKPESMQPELPPEFAWYAEKAGMQTFMYGGKRWNKTQAKCTFDLVKRPMIYFQTHVLGLPGPSISRPTFVDFGLEDAGEILADPRDCFQSKTDWGLLQGYLAGLAEDFVAPLLEEDVISNNGGLITKRTLRESLYGYAAPILQLSLAKDDPRAMKFNMLANDPSLDGPARCLSSSDVENPFTACRFASLNTTTNADGSVRSARVFAKVPNTYHTGKDDDKRAGAFFTYHGDRNIADIWPGGTIPFAGGAQDLPGSVQFGYSDGMQFPPFGAIDKPGAVLSVFVPGFVLPLRFAFSEDVVVEGIKLKRFRVVPETFSSSRSDAKTFDMDQVKQDGLFNLTGIMTGVTYFSKPHFRPSKPFDMADIDGLAAFDPVRDDSYIDVEPITGKTMNADIKLQLNAGTTPGVFDQFHKTVYPVKALPVLHVAQHASVVPFDAKFFKRMVYGTEKLIKLTTIVSACLGALFLVVGLALIMLHAIRHGAAVAAAEAGVEGMIKAYPSGDDVLVGEGDVEMATTASMRKSSSVAGVAPPPKPPSRRGRL